MLFRSFSEPGFTGFRDYLNLIKENGTRMTRIEQICTDSFAKHKSLNELWFVETLHATSFLSEPGFTRLKD